MKAAAPPELSVHSVEDALQRPPGGLGAQRHLRPRNPQQRDRVLQRPQVPLLRQHAND